MSENKKIQKVKEDNEGKKKISERSLAIIITAAILAVVLIATVVVFIVDSVKKDKGFDYLSSDLTKYVEFTEDYKNFKLNVDIAKPKDIDVDVAILSILRADKEEEPLHNGALVTSPITIGVGDIVHIWYRGYLIGEDGEEINVNGMSNFGSSSPSSLEIGSASFIPGFEYNLIGQSTGDANKFEKITEGKPTAEQIAYVSFTRVTDGVTSTKTTQSNVRIDLSSDKVDDDFGNGFMARIMLSDIGQKFDFQVENKDGKMYAYTDVTINFVTECEDKPLIVESYFPYDYSTENLRNEKAIFEVYVDGVVDYEAPEFCDEYINQKIEDDELGITLEKLNEYEGNTLVDKYRAYAKESINKLYEEEYKDLVEKAIWDHYQSIAKALKYPAIKVDKIYDEYINDVESQFESSGGQVYNNYTGSYNTYQTLETYAPAYLGISSSTDWRAYIHGMAESLVKERLIMYYILRTENLIPSDEEFAKLYDATREEYLNEYIEQYLEYEEKTREDFTDEEYAKFVEERKGEIFSYYDEDYFKETTYYNIVSEKILDWPEIVTLDERRAYPVKK